MKVLLLKEVSYKWEKGVERGKRKVWNKGGASGLARTFFLVYFIINSTLYYCYAEQYKGVTRMKVYICDDSKSDLMRMQHYLNKYAQAENIDMEVEEFMSARELILAHNEAKEKPVLIFLDIFMSQLDGIEAAKKFRKAGIKTSIIFTTSSDGHAMEAFQVHADGYLHKPFDYEEFCHAMSKVSGLLQTKFKTIEVKIERMNRKFRIKDICFAETDNHGVQIHCVDNVYRASISMEGLKEIIGEESFFIMCGRSYMVNLAYVETLDNDVICMKDGEKIPIPVRLRKQIREQYQQYLLEK